jgi:HEAT repeat protein
MRSTILVGLVILMAGCGKKEYSVPSLLDTLKDKDPKMRYYAAKELGHFGAQAKDAVPALTATLKDEDKTVRMGAAYALAEIGPDARTAIPALGEASKDQEESVRKAAAYALKRLQDPNPQAKADDKSTKPHKHKRKLDTAKG